MAWAFERAPSGLWYFQDMDNPTNRFEFDYEDMPHIAVALAQEYRGDDMRDFVSGEWEPLREDDGI